VARVGVRWAGGARVKRALTSGEIGVSVLRVTLEGCLCPRALAREWVGEGTPEEAEHYT
jgi:hypothetical protein